MVFFSYSSLTSIPLYTTYPCKLFLYKTPAFTFFPPFLVGLGSLNTPLYPLTSNSSLGYCIVITFAPIYRIKLIFLSFSVLIVFIFQLHIFILSVFPPLICLGILFTFITYPILPSNPYLSLIPIFLTKYT